MKKFKSIIPALLLLFTLAGFSGCEKQTTLPNDNLVCGVENPLTDLEWLKNYRENVQKTQDILSIQIDLYRVIDKKEHIFRINISSPFESITPEQGNISYSTEWRNCAGELIFHVPYPGTPPIPSIVEDFMKDKEFISELFYFVKQ